MAQAALLEQTTRLARYRGSRVDDANLLPDDVLDEVDHEWIMSTAEHDRINMALQHRVQRLVQDAARLRAVEVACFDLLDKPRAVVLEQLDSAPKTLDH